MADRAQVIAIDPDNPDPAVIEAAAEVIRSGRLVAFGTETVYGLGADAWSAEAVLKIFEAKGRPAANPVIVHVDSLDQARQCVSAWPDRAERLAESFWPGPLTFVLPRSPIIPDVVTAGQETVGVRMPDSAVTMALIRRCGRPIAAPSANRSTGISPTEARHVRDDLGGRIDLILDSGPTRVGLESAVIDLSGERPVLLRPGTLGRDRLQDVLGDTILLANPNIKEQSARSPGLMPVHYAPRTPTFRVEAPGVGLAANSWCLSLPLPAGEGRVRVSTAPASGPSPGLRPPSPGGRGQEFAVTPPGVGPFRPAGRWGLLEFGEALLRTPSVPSWRGNFSSPLDAAARLYSALHEADAQTLDLILIVMPPETAEWEAVRDRLTRASRPLIQKDDAGPASG